MVRHIPRATIPAAAISAAVLAVMLVVVPVEAKWCGSSDVLPARPNFSSPALVVDLEGCTELTAWLFKLYLSNNNVTCGNHGKQRTANNTDVARRSICRCSGLWSGDFCDTDVPGKIALAVVFSMVAVAALACFMVVVVNPKYIRPYRER
eukprot:gene7214-11366_t